MKLFKENTTYLYLIFLAVSFIWLRSAFGKFADSKFVESLSTTLTRFASNNPYPFYKNFLNSVAIPNSYIFALLTMWGELFAGASIGIIALFLLLKKNLPKLLLLIFAFGFLTGAFLNATFFVILKEYSMDDTKAIFIRIVTDYAVLQNLLIFKKK